MPTGRPTAEPRRKRAIRRWRRSIAATSSSSSSPGVTTPARRATRRRSPSWSGACSSATRRRTRHSRSTPRAASCSGPSIRASPASARIAASCIGRSARQGCARVRRGRQLHLRARRRHRQTHRTLRRGGRIDLRENLGRDPASQSVRLTTPGVIYRDLMIVGGRVSESLPASPGHVRAYDVRSGALRWTFRTIPQPGEPGYDTWPKEAWQYIGGANSWAGMTLDEQRGVVYVPTGSAAADFFGANRLGDNLYANCLLALDASTGKLRWHYQFVKHDLLDRDLPTAPTLVTLARARQTRRCAGADHQAGISVRARSRHGQARVSGRRSAGAALRRAGRSIEPHLPAAKGSRAVSRASGLAPTNSRRARPRPPPGARSSSRRCAATGRSSRSPSASIRLSTLASMAAPNGADPHTIPRPACCT